MPIPLSEGLRRLCVLGSDRADWVPGLAIVVSLLTAASAVLTVIIAARKGKVLAALGFALCSWAVRAGGD